MAKEEKRGQAAAGAAILVVIIAGLLILFILFIPLEERAKLLGENLTVTETEDDGEEVIGQVTEKNLLTVSPGRIDYLPQDWIEHPLPVVNIFTRTEAKVLAEKNTAYAKKGVFSEETSTFRFEVADLATTENALLSFSTDKIEGQLKIFLNGEELYRGGLPSGPLRVPKNLLKEENTLLFGVSSPGLAFWETNELALKNLKVIADVTNIEAQTSRTTFLVSDTEKNNLIKAVLKFQPDCNFYEVQPLHISINGEEIYDAVPDCDLEFVPIEISAGLIQEGENQIMFRTEQGAYVLGHLVLESRLREVDFPTYYLDLSLEEFQDIDDGEKSVRLRLSFVDVVVSKYGEVIVNGVQKHFDTKESSYVIDISDDVVRGTNSVKIKPRKTLEIRELKVDLRK